jgi:hypothetical protein
LTNAPCSGFPFLMKMILGFILLSACANLTTSGAKVKYIEHEGNLLEIQETADKIAAKNGCRFLGYIDPDTSLFPGSYSLHENEIHSALRNRAAKIGGNLVIANFYQKPARGAVLNCPEVYLEQNDSSI